MNYRQKGACIGESSPNGRMITAIFRLVKYSCASVIQPGKYNSLHIYIYLYIYMYYGGVLKSRGIRKSPLFQYLKSCSNTWMIRGLGNLPSARRHNPLKTAVK